MKSFLQLAQERESCRNFLEKEVPLEKVKACVKTASLAPSACNSQPWSYLVVKSKTVCEQIVPLLQEGGFNRFTDKCSCFVVVREESARLINGNTGEKMENQHFAQIDIGLSVMQFCLEATEQGLGTCIMGSFSEEKLKTVLGLTDEKPIRLVLAVGYPATEQPRVKRRKDEKEFVTIIE